MALGDRALRNVRIVHPSIDDAVDGLSGYVAISLGAIIGLYALNAALSIAYSVVFRGGSPAPIGVTFLATGVGLFVTVAVLWWLLDDRERPVAFPFRSPSAAEVAWALASVPLGLAAFQLGVEAAVLLGFEPPVLGYDLTDPLTAAGVLVGPILLAPVVEEAIFRGLFLGSLLDRGLSPWVAGLVSIVVFAGPHVWLGVAGVFGIAAWTVFPTILRLRFNNLTGATLLHLLNNVFAYVAMVGLSS